MIVSDGSCESFDSINDSDLISDGKPLFLVCAVVFGLESATESDSAIERLVVSTHSKSNRLRNTVVIRFSRIVNPLEWNWPVELWQSLCTEPSYPAGKRRPEPWSADSSRQARDQLRGNGFQIESIRAISVRVSENDGNQSSDSTKTSWTSSLVAGCSGYFRSLQGRQLGKQVSWFTREMATLLRVGTPMVEALKLSIDQSRGRFRYILLDLREQITSGGSFGFAIRRHPHGKSKKGTQLNSLRLSAFVACHRDEQAATVMHPTNRYRRSPPHVSIHCVHCPLQNPFMATGLSVKYEVKTAVTDAADCKAGMAGRQSDRHRQESEHNKRFTHLKQPTQTESYRLAKEPSTRSNVTSKKAVPSWSLIPTNKRSSSQRWANNSSPTASLITCDAMSSLPRSAKKVHATCSATRWQR